MAWRSAVDLLDSGGPLAGLDLAKAPADDRRVALSPEDATELWFDGEPGSPNCVTFAVRIFPETESALIYLSRDDPYPVRCDGPLTHITIVTDTGHIFVEKLSAISTFEVTIVDCDQSAAI